jgi:hypothetical protein
MPAMQKKVSHHHVRLLAFYRICEKCIIDSIVPCFSSIVGVWQFKFASECVAEVAARTLTAEAPSYATIMELDKKVREFPLPEDSLNSRSDFSTAFQRCVLEHIRETSK